MNPGMRMYLMAQENPPSRMATEDGKYQERGIGKDEYGNMLPYRERRPEFGETEARYHGDDGRWRAGTRRSAMGGREKKWEFTVTPQDEYRGRMDRHPDRMPLDRRPYGRRTGAEYDDRGEGRKPLIGFGESRMMHDEEEPMDEEPRHEMGRSRSHEDPLPLDEHTAKEWVKGMKNRDEKFPRGERWPAELLKPYAQRYGIPTSGPEFWEFYAIVHAMYSDFYPVGKKYGAKDGSPEFYVCLAKYWLEDEDAVDEKAAAYYDFVVKHD